MSLRGPPASGSYPAGGRSHLARDKGVSRASEHKGGGWALTFFERREWGCKRQGRRGWESNNHHLKGDGPQRESAFRSHTMQTSFVCRGHSYDSAPHLSRLSAWARSCRRQRPVVCWKRGALLLSTLSKSVFVCLPVPCCVQVECVSMLRETSRAYVYEGSGKKEGNSQQRAPPPGSFRDNHVRPVCCPTQRARLPFMTFTCLSLTLCKSY